MTLEQIKELQIPFSPLTSDMCIYADSAIFWINENTTLEYDVENPPSDMPSNVKLFIAKFCDVMSKAEGISSESIEGLSQSFSTMNDRISTIWQLASTLLGSYLKSSFKAVQAQNRWC